MLAIRVQKWQNNFEIEIKVERDMNLKCSIMSDDSGKKERKKDRVNKKGGGPWKMIVLLSSSIVKQRVLFGFLLLESSKSHDKDPSCCH